MFSKRRRWKKQSSGEVTVAVEGLSKRYFKPEDQREDGGSRQRSWQRRLSGFMPGRSDASGDWFWALQDVSFELREGDILGIVGRNGSGKSTMLKILSGVTTPTSGRARINGRVGSLLEVGTGFHPDLSGRENVFLSGSLLGVSRAEIARKFDEIVEFSGIAPFIDMPVKRYSSGMYVRLAYSVSALLRSDILILDEVFAVGDEAFRKKSRGHIDDIARDGRTILFVSHDMDAIKRICNWCLWLENGRVKDFGPVGEMTERYAESTAVRPHETDEAYARKPAWLDLGRDSGFWATRENRILRSVETLDGHGRATRLMERGSPLTVRIGYRAESLEAQAAYFTVFFLRPDGSRALVLYSLHCDRIFYPVGDGLVECRIPSVDLVAGDYEIMIDVGKIDFERLVSVDCIPTATTVRIREADPHLALLDADDLGSFVTPSSWRIAEAASQL